MSELPKEKWVDYSDSSFDCPESQSSSLLNPELQKLESINKNNKFVWLEVRCSMLTEDAKQKIRKIRFQEEGNAVFTAKTYNGFDIKVSRKRAAEYLSNSIPHVYGAVITVNNQKNFATSRPQLNRNKNKRKIQSEHKNRFTGTASKKNIKYVEKATGKQANNRALYEQRQIEESERKYSKREVKDIGDQIGAFRAKKQKKQIDAKQLKEVLNEYLNEQLQGIKDKNLGEHPAKALKKAASQPLIPKQKQLGIIRNQVWKRRQENCKFQLNDKKRQTSKNPYELKQKKMTENPYRQSDVKRCREKYAYRSPKGRLQKNQEYRQKSPRENVERPKRKFVEKCLSKEIKN